MAGAGMSSSIRFTRTLPAPQSELAQQIVKDPYNFDFLTLSQEAQEREIERGLLDHIRNFLLELGVGFTFEYRLTESLPKQLKGSLPSVQQLEAELKGEPM
jgi:predicted nuclease of restriction endonuclease-like (RecB) superfamily